MNRSREKCQDRTAQSISAYLLISHGSRDPRPQVAMQTLAELVRVRLADRQLTQIPRIQARTNSYENTTFSQLPKIDNTANAKTVVTPSWYPLVETATLELAPLPLNEQIQEFASKAVTLGCDRIQVLPLFLLPGVHVIEDIPQELAIAQDYLGEAAVIEQRPYLGSHPDLAQLLVRQRATIGADTTILLSHGTRRTGGNQVVEAVAEQLGAVAAYWSMKPTLEEQIPGLVAQGYQQIVILPYFLFSGGITDAIAQQVATLNQQFPQIQINLGQPIAATVELADLVLDLVK